MSKDYEVGKNKPPKKHQWKKGQSGNPAGSKGRKQPMELPFAYWLTEGLKEKVPVNEGGKAVKMPIGQALAKQLLRKALNANTLELKRIFEILQALNVFALEEGLINQKAAMKKHWEQLLKDAEALRKGGTPPDGESELA